MRLLLVEDEAGLRQRLAVWLRAEGFVVDEAGDGDAGLAMGRHHPLDLAIIDLGLPGTEGLTLIRCLRAEAHRYPILILTARGRWQDKVAGLEAGADDYVVKPFQREELRARLHALLRRAGGWAGPVLTCGPLALDTRDQSVSLHGVPLELTAFEYRVLAYLMHHAGEVVSKTALVEHLYEDDDQRDSNVMEVIIARLRRKLDPEGSLRPIETLRGRGYRLALERA